MNPVLIQIGPITIYWYGFLITVGALVGAYIASLEAKRRGMDPDHVWNALIVCLILGLVGARLYHVISSPEGGLGWSYYREHPIDIIAFWKGGLRGLGIYGAVIGGLLGLYLYTRFAHLKFWDWTDIGAPGLAIAQAIGRWGNFFNQELYGYPTDLPWGVYVDPAHRLPGFESFTKFHPTFLYESLWNFLVAVVLLVVGRRYGNRLKSGDLMLLYGILYPFGRFFVELQRPDAWKVAGIPAAQIVAVGSIVICGAILVLRHREWARRRPMAPEVS